MVPDGFHLGTRKPGCEQLQLISIVRLVPELVHDVCYCLGLRVGVSPTDAPGPDSQIWVKDGLAIGKGFELERLRCFQKTSRQ